MSGSVHLNASSGWPPLKVALIGCGAVAQHYYTPALCELEQSGRLRVVALLDPSAVQMAALRKSFPHARPLSTLDTVTQQPIDLAIVASPPRFHAEQSIRLLEAGVAVLCEKPMATTVAEGERMVAAAANVRRVLAIGLMRRFFPATQTIRQVLAQGILGKVKTFVCQEGSHFQWPTRSASFFQRSAARGGVLLDIGVHLLDLLIWWWGPPVEVEYEDDSMGGVEANCRIRLRFAQGHSGEVRLSRDWPLANRYVIECERGWLSWQVHEAAKVQLGFTGVDHVLDGSLHQPAAQQRGLGQPGFTFEQSFVNQVLDVAAAVQGQGQPLVSGAEGLHSLRLIEQCYQQRTVMPMPWLSANEQEMARQLSQQATA